MNKKRSSLQPTEQVRKKRKISSPKSPNKSAKKGKKSSHFFRQHFKEFDYLLPNIPLMNSGRYHLPDGSMFPEPFVLKKSGDDSKAKRRDLAVVSNYNFMFAVAYISQLPITQLQ